MRRALLVLVAVLMLASAAGSREQRVRYGRIRIVNALDWPAYAVSFPLAPVDFEGLEVLPGRKHLIRRAYDRAEDSVAARVNEVEYVLQSTNSTSFLPRTWRVVVADE